MNDSPDSEVQVQLEFVNHVFFRNNPLPASPYWALFAGAAPASGRALVQCGPCRWLQSLEGPPTTPRAGIEAPGSGSGGGSS